MLAVIGAAAAGVLGVVVSVFVFRLYGWGVFVTLPIAVGFLAAIFAHAPREGPRLARCCGVAALAVFVTGVALLMGGLEGAICLLMAAPLWVPLALAGGVLGYLAMRVARSAGARGLAALGLMAAVPSLMGAEAWARLEAPVFAVTSTVEIDAPPQRVWENVVEFGDLPGPREWLFMTGVAYPIRARIVGRGVGAVRQCEFNTGAFEEPIEVWDEPRRLAFSVRSNPAPMKEWSIYTAVNAPHLHGFFVSQHGQFNLVPLPGGRTRLEGTTWYRHHLWPATYWQLWSDWVIHSIHMRVLNHIKTITETKR